MRILVTGAAGMLASALVPHLRACGHEVVATDLVGPLEGAGGELIEHLDVREADEVEARISTGAFELVLHLAAETELEACERDPVHAWRTNAFGTKLVALACRRAGSRLAYVSTAGVFDGEKESPYDEFDEPRPINRYGASKLAGERFVQQYVTESFVVRAGWMVGGGPKDHKFVAKILRQLEEGATTLYAVGDKLGTPTYAPDFSRCLEALVTSDAFGLYHMSCEGTCSRYDVTQAILELLGRDDVTLVQVGSEFFAEEYFAPRPRSEAMRNLMLELHGLNTMRSWQAALGEYLAEEFALAARSRPAPAPCGETVADPTPEELPA
ncbi:MAG TPA: SDR family oxidoreductase [Acidimicrobiales bacterium]|nr:SDR family oxidoreductase [Acidimicrobiales bacterium]